MRPLLKVMSELLSGVGFEPTKLNATVLKTVPFDHSGIQTRPLLLGNYRHWSHHKFIRMNILKLFLFYNNIWSSIWCYIYSLTPCELYILCMSCYCLTIYKKNT